MWCSCSSRVRGRLGFLWLRTGLPRTQPVHPSCAIGSGEREGEYRKQGDPGDGHERYLRERTAADMG